MHTYEIINETTNERKIIHGYSVANAFKRADIADPENWEVMWDDFED
jgi:hypothetical protein